MTKKNEAIYPFLSFWSRNKTIINSFLSWFFSSMGLFMMFGRKIDAQVVPIIDEKILFSIGIAIGVLFCLRNRILIWLSKRAELFKLYQIEEISERFLAFSFSLWIAMILVSPFISQDQKLRFLFFEFWTRFFGLVILLALASQFLSFLTEEGEIKVLYEQISLYLNDLSKCRPWLDKFFKKVENFLSFGDISVSHGDLIYGLSVKMIKNENVEPILRNLKNSLLSEASDEFRESLYDCLVKILGDKNKISQRKRISIGSIISWFGKIQPGQLIQVIILLLGIILSLLTKTTPL